MFLLLRAFSKIIYLKSRLFVYLLLFIECTYVIHISI